MYCAVHEAGHAVVAVALGGFAEEIVMGGTGKFGHAGVSWPSDAGDNTHDRLLTMAAGAAATAIYKKQGIGIAIFETGLGDVARMKQLGSNCEDAIFMEAKSICRENWSEILAVASAVRAKGRLSEHEILLAMDSVATAKVEGDA